MNTNSTLIKNSKLLDGVRTELNSKFLEREDEINCILTALVSNTNVQFIGAPGTGKSALANSVSHLLNCSFFKVNLDQDLDPDFVIGHISLKEMRDNDRIIRNTSGKIADGQLVFLDECNKCNSAMKNALLLPLNERQVDIGDGIPRDTEIRSVIGASNEYPGCTSIDDDTDHLVHDPNWDRWALRMEVRYIEADHNFKDLLINRFTVGKVDKSLAIDLSIIDEMRMALYSVNLDNVMDLICKFRTLLQRQAINLSDRRWMTICKLISAQTVMRGSLTAKGEDLMILEHALWRTPEEKSITDMVIQDNIKSQYIESKKILGIVKATIKSTLEAIKEDDINCKDTKSKSRAVAMLTSSKDLLVDQVRSAGSKNWTCPKALKVKEEIGGLIQSLGIEAHKRMNLNINL